MNTLTNKSSANNPAKSCLLARNNKGHELFMDGKAYLRPATDVEVRDIKHKMRPHHYFRTQVRFTSSSFCYMTGHQEIMDQ